MKTTALLTVALGACLLAACASKPAAKQASAAAAAPSGFTETLAGDAAFAFGKSGIGDVSEGARQQLDALASRLQGSEYGLVRIVGHSDRIGSDKANMALSTRRAHSVRDYLLERGVPDAKMVATGRGPYEPVVPCEGERRQALIDCLAPNRRVEIRVDPPF